MSSRETIARSVRHIQPIWSTSTAEARSRVVKLYKTWYRQIPTIVEDYNLPYTASECRSKLHDEFMKQKYLSGIRQIDTLVMKHQLELKEICCMQRTQSHLLNYWTGDTIQPAQHTKFLSKFLVGQN